MLLGQLTQAQAQLAKIEQQGTVATRTHYGTIEGVEAAVIQDPRYAQRLGGLFADVTVFLQSYGNPAESWGRILVTLLLTGMLLCAELAPLLAVSFVGSTPFDVDRIAQARADAARFVAQAEIDIARAYSASPLVVRPEPDPRRSARDEPGAASVVADEARP